MFEPIFITNRPRGEYHMGGANGFFEHCILLYTKRKKTSS
jgi:hypothetical protein